MEKVYLDCLTRMILDKYPAIQLKVPSSHPRATGFVFGKKDILSGRPENALVFNVKQWNLYLYYPDGHTWYQLYVRETAERHITTMLSVIDVQIRELDHPPEYMEPIVDCSFIEPKWWYLTAAIIVA